MSRWARTSLWVAGVAGVAGIAVLLGLLNMFGGSLACGRLPVRVRGVVVDAISGAPVEGAFLLTLRDPGIARNPEALESWRGRARWSESPRGVGSTRTDAAGAFEIIIAIGISQFTGSLGIPWPEERESAFDVAGALLVEKEGYAPLVHETKDARWEERQEGKIVGTLDVGTIRLARQGPR